LQACSGFFVFCLHSVFSLGLVEGGTPLADAAIQLIEIVLYRPQVFLNMQDLDRVSGVATRMAVAMLHWMRPNQFPMLDVRVVRSLGWEDPPSWENLDFYERFPETGSGQRRPRPIGT